MRDPGHFLVMAIGIAFAGALTDFFAPALSEGLIDVIGCTPEPRRS